MPKITNDGLTQSGTRCFIVVPTSQQWAKNGYASYSRLSPVNQLHWWRTILMSSKDLKDLWSREQQLT